MIRFLFFVLLSLHAYCCRNGSRTSSKGPLLVEEQIPFREELVMRKGLPVNYYFALFLLVNFKKSHELDLIIDIVEACRESPLSSYDVKRKCRRFIFTDMKTNCQIALEMFYTPNKPCFYQEEVDRRKLRERGVEIINEGSHGKDLLHILNHMRGGRMKDVDEAMYYVKRFQLYTEISRRGLKPFLETSEKCILDESGVSQNPQIKHF